MTDVVLGFKSFDIHELLCHFVAKEAGLYDEQDLSVKLMDTNFVSDEVLPENFFSVACGAALLGWLNGNPQKVVFVATDRPLFWLYAQQGVESVHDLQHARIANYPDFAPPSHFLKAILNEEGVNTGGDIKFMPARDDTARIGLLTAGDVDAAVVSSALPPAVMAKHGLKQVMFFGDHVRVPTTGLAIAPSFLERDPEVVGAMVKVFNQSLQLIKNRDAVVRKVLGYYFNIPLRAMSPTLEFLSDCFCDDGQSPTEILDAATKLMQLELQCDESQVINALYDFSLC